jgi:hypothetical protein
MEKVFQKRDAVSQAGEKFRRYEDAAALASGSPAKPTTLINQREALAVRTGKE